MMRLATVSLLIFLMYGVVSCSAAITDTPARSYYTDDEAREFIDRFPGLAGFTDTEGVPEDILNQLSIDTTALVVLESYIGGCIDLTVYDLSPSYELVVDRNACFGFGVAILSKEEDNPAIP